MYKIFVVVLSATLFLSACTNRDNDIHGAWAYMQLFVEKRLQSPDSADFPFGGAEEGVTPLGDGRYQVNSYVDSNNAFGASLRTRFKGVIVKTETGDEWELESLELF